MVNAAEACVTKALPLLNVDYVKVMSNEYHIILFMGLVNRMCMTCLGGGH